MKNYNYTFFHSYTSYSSYTKYHLIHAPFPHPSHTSATQHMSQKKIEIKARSYVINGVPMAEIKLEGTTINLSIEQARPTTPELTATVVTEGVHQPVVDFFLKMGYAELLMCYPIKFTSSVPEIKTWSDLANAASDLYNYSDGFEIYFGEGTWIQVHKSEVHFSTDTGNSTKIVKYPRNRLGAVFQHIAEQVEKLTNQKFDNPDLGIDKLKV